MASPPHLDRLSALLAGLAPRVRLARPAPTAARLDVAADAAPGLHLYLLTEGKMALESTSTASRELPVPCIVVCRADTPHALSADNAAAWSQVICARAWLDGPVAALLLGEFSEPLAVALAGAESSLQHVVKLIGAELQAPRCGQPVLLERAGDILFIGLLRHLIAHPDKRGGLLNGLAEPRIARTLVAIHSRPQAHWTLETLAAEAGMSRTAFANAFRDAMRQTPGKYLAAIRLAIARRAVQAGKGLKSAARDAGYASPSALSRALARPATLQ